MATASEVFNSYAFLISLILLALFLLAFNATMKVKQVDVKGFLMLCFFILIFGIILILFFPKLFQV